MGPYGPLERFEGVLGTLKSLYGVYSRYIRIPGLRAHARGPWFQPHGLRFMCLGSTGFKGLVFRVYRV